jgi:hypothetical protein
MIVYFKQNVGLKTPQEVNLDFFQIELIGKDEIRERNSALIRFFTSAEEAIQGRTPPAERVVFWPGSAVNVDKMREELFELESVQTTSIEIITLQNPEIVQ